MFVLKVVLHEVVVRDDLADVVLVAGDVDDAEVVDGLAVGLHLSDVEVKPPVGVRPVLLDVGESVVVGVGELRLRRLEIVAPCAVVGERRRYGVVVPRIRRRAAAVVLVHQCKLAFVERQEAVVEVPGADDVARGEGGGLVGGRAEHDVQLPAVRDAVAVKVGVKGLERVLRPEIADVDGFLAAYSD